MMNPAVTMQQREWIHGLRDKSKTFNLLVKFRPNTHPLIACNGKPGLNKVLEPIFQSVDFF